MPITVLSAEQAKTNLRRNRLSRWPDGRKINTRLGAYTICDMEATFRFTLDDLIFTTGSCFARNIEKKLDSLGFKLPMLGIETAREERVSETANEILNKYTTASVLNELRWSLGLAPFPASGYIAVDDGLWHDPYLHPNVPPVSLERARERRADIHRLVSILPQCRVFIMTLGLVEAWHDAETGLYLNGVPPAAASRDQPERFTFHRQSHADILADLEAIYDILSNHGHPDFKFVLSVSPVPFKATYSGQDAIAANTYSKSVLRAAAEEFAAAHENVNYFPSYEMVTLSDRANAYTQDNIHIQSEMVSRVMDIAAAKFVDGFKVDKKHESLSGYGNTPAAIYKQAIKARRELNYDLSVRLFELIENAKGIEETGVDLATFCLMYGTTLARAGRNADAEPHLYKAVALAPRNALYNFKLGLITARLRRPHALQHFLEAVALEPNKSHFHWRLGEQYFQLGDLDRAIASQQEALRLEPGLPRSMEALEKYAALMKAPDQPVREAAVA